MSLFGVDVLIEVLIRLPVKQTCQLKTVSKQWLCIISSPHFKKLYNERSMSSNKPQLLIVEESDEGHTWSYHGLLSRTLHMSTTDISTGVIRRVFSMVERGRHYSFISICNLFCFNQYGSFRVCNPITREKVYLPYPGFPRAGFSVGYVSDTNEYKIIHVGSTRENDDPGYKFHFQILTLKDGGPVPSSWRKIENSTMPEWEYYGQSVNIGSSIYWLICDREGREKRIVSLELKSERFAAIRYPDASSVPSYKEGDRERLTEAKGKLCLAHFSKEDSTMTLLVLVDDRNNIWMKECSVDLSEFGGWVNIIGYLQHCDDGNGEIILSSMVYSAKCADVLSYNVKDRQFRRLSRFQNSLGFHANFYFDRLFSLGESRRGSQ